MMRVASFCRRERPSRPGQPPPARAKARPASTSRRRTPPSGSPYWPPTPASATSRSWPGGTWTTPKPVDPRYTRAASPNAGPPPGIDVELTTSRPPGAPRRAERDGYRTRRPAGRYLIFPHGGGRPPASTVGPRPDAVVEIWNGMPFFSPLWARHPGSSSSTTCTTECGTWCCLRSWPGWARWSNDGWRHPSTPTRQSSPCRSRPGGRSSRPWGYHPPGCPWCRRAWTPASGPGAAREKAPLVVAVGRLVSYKRFDLLVEVLVRVRARHPHLRAVVAGEGSERARLEALVAGPRGPGLAAPARPCQR